jgi:hypothetical protein
MDDLRRLSETISSDLDDFIPEVDSTYIAASNSEDRSSFSGDLSHKYPGMNFVDVAEQGSSSFQAVRRGQIQSVRLRSRRDLQAFVEQPGLQMVYLDITGLAHHIWAPIVKESLIAGINLTVIYVEPDDYRPNPHPIEGEIYDLSERICGISPLPGFMSLTESNEQASCFVPLLGFEGTRLAYLLEQVQPQGKSIVPIIGVPGFRIEYPFHTYQGNRTALLESKAWRNVRYAKANCPFSLFYLLDEIAKERNSSRLKVAPIGTKPHALGAVLYAMYAPTLVELVYDHPIRRAKRTIGTGRLLRYPLKTFYNRTIQPNV